MGTAMGDFDLDGGYRPMFHPVHVRILLCIEANQLFPGNVAPILVLVYVTKVANAKAPNVQGLV